MSWIKYWKYCLASFFSFWKEQPQPPCPIPQENFPAGVDSSTYVVRNLLLGRAKRFANTILERKKTPSRFSSLTVDAIDFRNSFLQSILMSKKGMLRPNQADINKSLVETYKMLTEPNKVSSEELELPVKDVYPTFHGRGSFIDQISTSIEDVVAEVFNTADAKDLILSAVAGDGLSVPSANANYVSSRDAAGTLGDLLHTFRLLGLLRKQRQLTNPAAIRVLSMLHQFFGGSWSKLSIEDFISSKIIVEPFWNDNQERMEQEDLPVFVGFQPSFIERLREVNEEVSYLLTKLGMVDAPIVKLVGLAEALKVRVISKGPGYIYYRLKPFQKLFHKLLRRNPVFRFIGEPVSSSAIQESFRVKPGDFFISGDYKDATNNLNPLFSEKVLSCLAKHCGIQPGDDLYELFMKSMTRHRISDPEAPRTQPRSSIQRNGQLMGAILSFPVLCIVNAAVLLTTYRIGGNRHIPFNHLNYKLRVNGDDFVAVGPRENYPVWQKVCRLTGMEESPGKTFLSSSFLNMNSREFTFKGFDLLGKPLFKEVPFINLGLLKGATRSTGVVSVVGDAADRGLHDEGSLPTRAHALLEQCPSYLRCAVYDRFLNTHKKVLHSVRLPWFVPQTYGGVGMPMLASSGRVWNNSSLPIKGKDIDGESFKFEELFFKFGKTRCYPTKEDLSAMHASLLDTGNLLKKFRPLVDPTVYTIYRACLKFLPEGNIPWSPLHGRYSSATPLLQNVILLAEWFLQTESLEDPDGELSTNFLIDDELALDIVGSRRTAKLRLIKNNEKIWSDCQKLARGLNLRPFEEFELKQFGPRFITNDRI